MVTKKRRRSQLVRAWIVTHAPDIASAHGIGVDYALAIEPSQHQAATTGGFR